jgi:hypothetical protein
MIAVNNPIIGGKSDALAIPKLKGKANKKTMNPEAASEAKFSFNPVRPSLGKSSLFFIEMTLQSYEKYLFVNPVRQLYLGQMTWFYE